MIKKLITVLMLITVNAFPILALSLNGAGATFPAPIYTKWFSDYAKETGVKVNYQAIGSGGGIKQFTAGVVDFGASDAFMNNAEISAAGGNILHIPTVIGGVVIIYNLPGIENLKLDSNTIAEIFMGNITKWNDPQLVALNPDKNLPNKSIIVVRRADSSGTTSIFTNYLTKTNTSWAAKVGEGKTIKWPIGLGGKGNFGVAGLVKQMQGAIGYAEFAYAMENKIAYATLKNKKGNFIAPSIETIKASAEAILNGDSAKDFRVNITNAPGADSYPISGLTWILIPQKSEDKSKGEALKNLLLWCLSDGQKYAEKMYYAPLPANMVTKINTVLNNLK
jgi:phosphate transport system substrate-binding protein